MYYCPCPCSDPSDPDAPEEGTYFSLPRNLSYVQESYLDAHDVSGRFVYNPRTERRIAAAAAVNLNNITSTAITTSSSTIPSSPTTATATTVDTDPTKEEYNKYNYSYFSNHHHHHPHHHHHLYHDDHNHYHDSNGVGGVDPGGGGERRSNGINISTTPTTTTSTNGSIPHNSSATTTCNSRWRADGTKGEVLEFEDERGITFTCNRRQVEFSHSEIESRQQQEVVINRRETNIAKKGEGEREDHRVSSDFRVGVKGSQDDNGDGNKATDFLSVLKSRRDPTVHFGCATSTNIGASDFTFTSSNSNSSSSSLSGSAVISVRTQQQRGNGISSPADEVNKNSSSSLGDTAHPLVPVTDSVSISSSSPALITSTTTSITTTSASSSTSSSPSTSHTTPACLSSSTPSSSSPVLSTLSSSKPSSFLRRMTSLLSPKDSDNSDDPHPPHQHALDLGSSVDADLTTTNDNPDVEDSSDSDRAAATSDPSQPFILRSPDRSGLVMDRGEDLICPSSASQSHSHSHSDPDEQTALLLRSKTSSSGTTTSSNSISGGDGGGGGGGGSGIEMFSTLCEGHQPSSIHRYKSDEGFGEEVLEGEEEEVIVIQYNTTRSGCQSVPDSSSDVDDLQNSKQLLLSEQLNPSDQDSPGVSSSHCPPERDDSENLTMTNTTALVAEDEQSTTTTTSSTSNIDTLGSDVTRPPPISEQETFSIGQETELVAKTETEVKMTTMMMESPPDPDSDAFSEEGVFVNMIEDPDPDSYHVTSSRDNSRRVSDVSDDTVVSVDSMFCSPDESTMMTMMMMDPAYVMENLEETQMVARNVIVGDDGKRESDVDNNDGSSSISNGGGNDEKVEKVPQRQMSLEEAISKAASDFNKLTMLMYPEMRAASLSSSRSQEDKSETNPDAPSTSKVWEKSGGRLQNLARGSPMHGIPTLNVRITPVKDLSSSATDSEQTDESSKSLSSPKESPIYEDHEFNFNKKGLRKSSSLKTNKTPPGTPHRKKAVRFADAMGLDLESVRHVLNTESPPRIPASAMADLKRGLSADRLEVGSRYLTSCFTQPGAANNFVSTVVAQKVRLENAIITDLTITGFIRVSNIAFHKHVRVRYTHNNWATFHDIAACYIQDSCDGPTDRFSFSIVAPAHLAPGDRLEFAVSYNAEGAEFWDNNDGRNYVFECFAKTVPTENDREWIHFL